MKIIGGIKKKEWHNLYSYTYAISLLVIEIAIIYYLRFAIQSGNYAPLLIGLVLSFLIIPAMYEAYYRIRSIPNNHFEIDDKEVTFFYDILNQLSFSD